MILDACFEIPKLEESILNLQTLFNARNMELKISQHIKRTCLWFVTLTVEDTGLILTLAPANNKKSLYIQNVIIRNQCLQGISDLSVWVYIPVMFLYSLVDLVISTHNHV